MATLPYKHEVRMDQLIEPENAPMADPSPDSLGPRLPLFPSLTPEQRAQFDALDGQAREAREKMLAFVYVAVRLQLSGGASHETIRSDLLGSIGTESEVLGVYFQETLVADIQNTVEDALMGRPPRYPQWIDADLLGGLNHA